MGFFKWLTSIITGAKYRSDLAELLKLLRSQGVTEYKRGEFHLVFRLDFDETKALPALDALEQAAGGKPEKAERTPSDDELLYGRDGYGLGVGKE